MVKSSHRSQDKEPGDNIFVFFATTELDAGSVRGENLMFPGCIASFELSFEDN